MFVHCDDIYLVCLLCIVNYCYGQEAFLSAFLINLKNTHKKNIVLGLGLKPILTVIFLSVLKSLYTQSLVVI